MTDRYEKMARDIMDQACLPIELDTVDRALREDIAQALRDAAAESSTDKADPQRIIDWLREKPRQRAVHAFTEGPERQIAYQVEMAIDEAAAEARAEENEACAVAVKRGCKYCCGNGYLQYTDHDDLAIKCEFCAAPSAAIRARMDKEG